MLQDSKLLVSGAISATDNTITAQIVTGTGNVISTNVIDLSAGTGLARDIGEGNPVIARAVVVAAQAGGTSVEIQIVSADSSDLITTGVTVLASSGAIATATLAVGYALNVILPPRVGSVGQRYLGIRYVIAGTSTAGSFITDFGLEVQDSKKFYPSGFSIA